MRAIGPAKPSVPTLSLEAPAPPELEVRFLWVFPLALAGV